MLLSTLDLLAKYLLKRFRRPVNFLTSIFHWRIRQGVCKLPSKAYASKSFRGKIPMDSWDSHMHVLDPIKYPVSPDAQYLPKAHDLFEALWFERTIGLSNIVLVQPSIYGNDNSCLLDALRKLGPRRGRGVVTFDPETITTSVLEGWHEIGVRGARINLQSVGKQMDPTELAEILHKYADIIRPFGWVLQLYLPLSVTVALEKVIPQLGVKVCLDHFGQPTVLPQCLGFEDPYMIPGFKSLVGLLAQDSTYIKMSAPYRIGGEPKSLEIMAKELLRVVGMSKVVFATDWPHTRFEGLDIEPFMEKVVDWCAGDEILIDRVFKSNAEDLWDVNLKLRG